MERFVPDTSCMIAAVCVWHEHHERAAAEFERRWRRRETMCVAAPALIESYAVLTRLPPPHRLSPGDAIAVLAGNFMPSGRVIALDGGSTCRLLRTAPAAGVHGGRTYDAVIAACAIEAGARTLLTFNDDHFRTFADQGLEIVVPP